MSGRKAVGVVLLVLGGVALTGSLAHLNRVGLSHPDVGMNVARIIGSLALPVGLIAMGLRRL